MSEKIKLISGKIALRSFGNGYKPGRFLICVASGDVDFVDEYGPVELTDSEFCMSAPIRAEGALLEEAIRKDIDSCELSHYL